MQYRMKTHPLTLEQIDILLHEVQTGCLATINADGTPYATPVHFLYYDNAVYVHGLPKGQKIDNIQTNSEVGVSVYKMEGLLLDADGKPCDTNTAYQSVIIQGSASILADMELKKNVLKGFVEKYTPHLANADLPENMLKGTIVIEIGINSITGKYYN